MRRNRIEESRCREIACRLGVPWTEVRRAVRSFFGEMLSYSRSLPFDDPCRIYSTEKFEEYSKVWNIPSVGRLGPVYSRYLRWRGNEARKIIQKRREVCQAILSQDDFEHIAEDVLAGRVPFIPERKKQKDNSKKVWMVDKKGRRLARQVIAKD